MPNFDESILYYQLNYLPPNFVFKNLIDKENVTFLDSQTQNSDLARFSYIAFEPFLKISCNNNNITINNKIHKSCLFETLKSILNKYKLSTNKNLNVPFQTGAIGYLSYELNQYLENLPKPKPNGLNIPDMVFYLYSKIFAFV